MSKCKLCEEKIIMNQKDKKNTIELPRNNMQSNQ